MFISFCGLLFKLKHSSSYCLTSIMENSEFPIQIFIATLRRRRLGREKPTLRICRSAMRQRQANL